MVSYTPNTLQPAGSWFVLLKGTSAAAAWRMKPKHGPTHETVIQKVATTTHVGNENNR